jgi:hypothetical protein
MDPQILSFLTDRWCAPRGLFSGRRLNLQSYITSVFRDFWGCEKRHGVAFFREFKIRVFGFTRRVILDFLVS